MVLLLALCVLVGICAYLFVKDHYRRKNEPPGPEGLVQTLLFIVEMGKTTMNEAVYNLLEKNGDIASVRFIKQRWFIIGSHNLARKAYQQNQLSDRPFTISAKNLGLIGSNGDLWRTQRRFALNTLKDFGMGKFRLEQRIGQEADNLVEKIAETGTLNPETLLACAVCNVICSVAFNQTFDYDDKEFLAFQAATLEFVASKLLPMIELLPVLKYLPIFREAHLESNKNREIMRKVVKTIVDEHKESYEEGNVRDYIDAFLYHMKKDEDTFTEDQLMASAQDLFFAGTETTSSTLQWAIYFLAKYPDLQKQLYEEIQQKIGERMPSMSDRTEMPITEAILLEIHRYAAVFQLIGHSASENTMLGDYEICKGDFVLVSNKRLLSDPRIWPYPDEFNIGNFWKNGEFINRDHNTAFLFGKRSCLGENLARTELFIMLVRLIQNFHLSFPDGHGPDVKESRQGLVQKSPVYEITAKRR